MSEDLFLSYLEKLANNCLRDDPLANLHSAAWKQFLNFGLPKKSEDSFRYISLKDLYNFSFSPVETTSVNKTAFSQAILPECQQSHIVFVDGVFYPELSDLTAVSKQKILFSMHEAFQSHASYLKSFHSRSLQEEKDPFACLNLALHQNGAFFYLPPKIQAIPPIQCLNVVTQCRSGIIVPRIHVVLGPNSRCNWIHTYHLDPSLAGVSHLILPRTDISLEEGAILHRLDIIGEIPSSWHLDTVRAVLKKDARMESLSVSTGSKCARQSYQIQLKGQNSEANLNGLWMLRNNHCMHTHAIVDHEATHTRSMQRFKGVLNDISRSSFEGKIHVRSSAQKTQAYQLNNNLVLSSGAIANSKPNLEVFADDVKASHGATISQLSQEALFYLNTRGIGLLDSKQLLIRSFCREIIEQIPYSSISDKMMQRVVAL